MSVAADERSVVLADDRAERAQALAAAVEAGGWARVLVAPNGRRALELAPRADALLLQLDIADDAIQILRDLAHAIADGLPVLVVAADDSRAARRRALAAGARDFVVAADGSYDELGLRLGNALEVRDVQRGLEQRVSELTAALTRSRTAAGELRRELEQLHLESLHRLALAGEYRDDATHEHPQRVARTAGLIAREMNVDAGEVWALRHAAQLHDIGKIGVPDEILLKPGPLDPDEFELMKTHSVIGWQILSGPSAGVLGVAAEVALSHHERFDGGGYPNGLAGDTIPLPARITAVADVFDVITHVRPYREAFPVARAVEEIRRLSRTAFDPRVVGAFDVLDHEALLAPVEPEPVGQ